MTGQEPTWRVYLSEWLIVYTSDAHGPDGEQECRAVYARKYGGRVLPGDVRVLPAIKGRPADSVPYCVQLWLPNLKGEFKDRELADKLADEIAEDPPYGGAGLFIGVVQRGSAEEQELLAYGKKMLPDAR